MFGPIKVVYGCESSVVTGTHIVVIGVVIASMHRLVPGCRRSTVINSNLLYIIDDGLIDASRHVRNPRPSTAALRGPKLDTTTIFTS